LKRPELAGLEQKKEARRREAEAPIEEERARLEEWWLSFGGRSQPLCRPR